jgi:hypothetical protein
LDLKKEVDSNKFKKRASVMNMLIGKMKSLVKSKLGGEGNMENFP